MLRFLKQHLPDQHPLRIFWHRAKALVAALWYGFPARRLTVIGVTGTDGKTTTVGMIAHILHATGRPVAAASTAFLEMRGERTENATHLTSLSPFALQRFLRTAVRRGCSFAVIEMSSHGLVQGRTNYTFPTVAGITNMALEHLDYHGTMEQYRHDKGRLFRMLRRGGVTVVNGLDDSFEYFRSFPAARTIVCGPHDSDLWLENIEGDVSSTSAVLKEHSGSRQKLRLSIPGTYNLTNALCAIGCAEAVGVPVAESVSALASFPGIPGRMERIDEGQPFSVFVDFAVSPQAYEKTLQALRAIVGDTGRVLVLCGSCGNRMREKRPLVGRICSQWADVVVVTEDETYGEDPHTVVEEVWAGVDRAVCDARKLFDRREAMAYILRQARPGDAVALCGMGPFSSMTKMQGRIPWDERAIAREMLRSRFGGMVEEG